MGLFQRQPINNEAPLYTIGGQKTFLFVGLGNVGKEYEKTRHNLGFICIDHYADKNDFPGWVEKKDLHCLETSKTIGNARVILIKPTTLMNDSGKAVQAIQRFYRIDNSSTLIVHDELDIDFGKIRVRRGGSDAGNNGVKSLVKHGIDDTWRLRTGIGPKSPEQIESQDYVLGKFSKDQNEKLPKITNGVRSIIDEFVHSSGNLTSETRSFIN